MKFKASLDNTAKILTILIALVFAAIVFVPSSANQSAPAIAIGIGLWTIFGLTYAFSPRYYSIEDGKITVHRLFSKVAIAIANIEKAEISQSTQIGNTIRTFGVGGLFGYFGRFHNSHFGAMYWYVTRKDRIIVLTLHNSRIAISPNDTKAFLEALNN